MSIESVKEHLKKWGRDKDVLEFSVSSATVDLAAHALSVIPARIAKTLSFMKNENCILIVMAGDAKVDNQKFKKEFGLKAKMLSSEDVLERTGHAIGGVCPFVVNPERTDVYLDISLKRFDTVYPACGSGNSAIELTMDELFTYSGSAKWVDVCKGWEEIL